MIHVLVVDDEPQLLRSLVMNLSGRGYQVSAAPTGRTAVAMVAEAHPDLMVVDLGLPDIDGLEVIRQAKARRPQLPIIVLSARTGSADKVAALELGATDYITKPFDMNELFARLRATLRRAHLIEPDRPVEMGAVVVDLAARRVVRRTGERESTVHLTPTEWRMLEVMMRRPGGLITATELLSAMRGSPGNTERSYLRIYMQQLRKKLEADPSRPQYLITEPGLGYRFVR